jgi:predicted nuclease with RNAse H fold
MKSSTYIAGIDYGAKLAGTTAIAYIEKGRIVWQQSKIKQDADAFIREFVKEKQIKLIGLDAPLSLPKIYKNHEKGEDYFYREADKLLGAMSPMFLGGLTARAMQLCAYLEQTQTIEVYPAALAKKWYLEQYHYKKALSLMYQASKAIEEQITLKIAQKPDNWHQFDAILALASALRYDNQTAECFGDEQEGVIWV